MIIPYDQDLCYLPNLAPIEAPVLQVTDMLGFEEISVTWKEISKSGARGEVLGYRIQYWLSELHEDPVIQERKYYFDVLEPNRTAVIKGLKPFAQYRIQIQAFTESGFGIWSPEYSGGTFCGSVIYLLLNNRNNLRDKIQNQGREKYRIVFHA